MLATQYYQLYAFIDLLDDWWVPPYTVSAVGFLEIVPMESTLLKLIVAEVGRIDLPRTAGAELALYRFKWVCSDILVKEAEY